MKKFICEAPIGSGKSTAIRKWISSHKTEKFMVIVPTVNIAEEFYTKLIDMKVKSIQLCVNDNAFKEFHKAVHNEVNIIITTYNTTSKLDSKNWTSQFICGKFKILFFNLITLFSISEVQFLELSKIKYILKN